MSEQSIFDGIVILNASIDILGKNTKHIDHCVSGDSIIIKSRRVKFESEFIFFTFLEVPKLIGIYDTAYGILFKENKFSLVKAEITSPFYDSYDTNKVFEFDFYLSKI